MSLCLLQRGGPLRLVMVRGDEGPHPMKARVMEAVAPGSMVYTDEFQGYAFLDREGYVHETVNHSLGEYARGEVHVNGAEGRINLFKIWMAKFMGDNKQNLPLYEATFQYLHNHRELTSLELLKEILKIKHIPATTFPVNSKCFFELGEIR